jgi:hypothetical protein
MTAPAHGETEYSVVVPTLADANTTSFEYSAFLVSDPFTFYDSGLENGYSVDNLPPSSPAPFTAAYLAGGTHLHWTPSPASDFATFRLYRGSSPAFIPSAGTLVTATTDTGYVHVGGAGGYYKLSAVDVNGNESPFALVGPAQTTDAPSAESFELALEGARPNPSRGGRMLVHFVLPAEAPATLELFDLAGRRVARRDVGSLGAGRHAVEIAPGRRLAAGIYLVQLTQNDRRRIVRATILD